LALLSRLTDHDRLLHAGTGATSFFGEWSRRSGTGPVFAAAGIAVALITKLISLDRSSFFSVVGARQVDLQLRNLE